MKKYILLCDYGLDDAAATVALLSSVGPGDRVDIVPVGGNVSGRRAFSNARILLSNLSLPLEGVRLVDSSSVPQPEEDLPSIHGRDGMGDFLALREVNVPVAEFDSWLGELSGEEILISLGPCTVTRAILERIDLPNLWIMGGNIAHEPNFQGREFNHALDPEAFAFCVKRPHRAATLDTCRHERFNFVKNPPSTENPLLKRLFSRSLHYATARHDDRCYVYDWVLVYALFHPEEFTSRERVDPDGNRVTVLEYLG